MRLKITCSNSMALTSRQLASVDNLTGFSEAIRAAFPQTQLQKRLVHQVRNSIRYVSHKDVKAVTADLNRIYTAPTEGAALAE